MRQNISIRTDEAWKNWAELDPYYAVLTSEQFKDGKNRDQFFASGTTYFAQVRQEFQALGIPLSPNGTALDYGCGVGRVLKPMSEYFDKAIGADIASKMIEITRQNAPRADTILLGSQSLGDQLVGRQFDFIHSALVLQHIRPKRGMTMIRDLIRTLSPDGRLLLQLPIMSLCRWKYMLNQTRYAHPVMFKLSRLLLGKKDWKTAPVMEMNVYPLKQIYQICDEEGLEIKRLSLSTYRDRYLVFGDLYGFKNFLNED